MSSERFFRIPRFWRFRASCPRDAGRSRRTGKRRRFVGTPGFHKIANEGKRRGPMAIRNIGQNRRTGMFGIAANSEIYRRATARGRFFWGQMLPQSPEVPRGCCDRFCGHQEGMFVLPRQLATVRSPWNTEEFRCVVTRLIIACYGNF